MTEICGSTAFPSSTTARGRRPASAWSAWGSLLGTWARCAVRWCCRRPRRCSRQRRRSTAGPGWGLAKKLDQPTRDDLPADPALAAALGHDLARRGAGHCRADPSLQWLDAITHMVQVYFFDAAQGPWPGRPAVERGDPRRVPRLPGVLAVERRSSRSASAAAPREAGRSPACPRRPAAAGLTPRARSCRSA